MYLFDFNRAFLRLFSFKLIQSLLHLSLFILEYFMTKTKQRFERQVLQKFINVYPSSCFLLKFYIIQHLVHNDLAHYDLLHFQLLLY